MSEVYEAEARATTRGIEESLNNIPDTDVDETLTGMVEAALAAEHDDVSIRVTKYINTDNQQASWVISIKYKTEINRLGLYMIDLTNGDGDDVRIETVIIGSTMRCVYSNADRNSTEKYKKYIERAISSEINKIKSYVTISEQKKAARKSRLPVKTAYNPDKRPTPKPTLPAGTKPEKPQAENPSSKEGDRSKKRNKKHKGGKR